MADFWYDVLRPVYGWLTHLTLSVSEHKQLLVGFNHPKGLDPKVDPAIVTVTALLVTGNEGGKRLIEVLCRSLQPCNQAIGDYLRTEWDDAVNFPSLARPSRKTEFWSSVLTGVKDELAELLSTAKLTALQAALIELLDRFSCISDDIYSVTSASLSGQGANKEAIKAVLWSVISHMLDNGTVASVLGLLSLAWLSPAARHLPRTWLDGVFVKAGLLGVDLPRSEL
eukprot:scpid90772/ scgid2139/ 